MPVLSNSLPRFPHHQMGISTLFCRNSYKIALKIVPGAQQVNILYNFAAITCHMILLITASVTLLENAESRIILNKFNENIQK